MPLDVRCCYAIHKYFSNKEAGRGSQDIMRDLWMEFGDEDEDGEAEKEETKDDGGAWTAGGVVGV